MNGAVKPSITTTTATTTTTSTSASPSKPCPPSSHPSSLDFASHFRSIFATRPSSSSATITPSTTFIPTLTSSSLPVLDGVRALLCLGMITYHSFEFLLAYVPRDAAEALFQHPLIWMLSVGPVIVDWFFVLTGFLTALPLLLQEKRWLRQQKDQSTIAAPGASSADNPHNFSVSSFWYRRFTRFLPSWVLVYLIHHLILFPEISMHRSLIRNQHWMEMLSTMPAESARADGNIPSMCRQTGFLPLQATMLLHLLPFGGCQGVQWSLGVQCQFYLFFPLLWRYLLKCSRRGVTAGQLLVRVMWVVVAVSSVMRVLAFFHELTTPLAHIEGQGIFFFWYSNTLTRMGTIAAGVILAYICTSSPLPSVLHARPLLSYLGHALHLLVLVLVRWNSEAQGEGPGMSVLFRTQQLVPITVKAEQHFPPSFHQLANIGRYGHYLVLNALLSVGSPGMAALICFSLLTVLHRIEPVAARVSQLLSSSVLAPIATLSYMAYLIHAALQMCFYSYYTAHIDPHWLPTVPVFATHTALLLATTFALSLPLYVLWDAPVVAWLSGAGRRLGGELWMRRYAWLCVGVSVLCHAVLVPGVLLAYKPSHDATFRVNPSDVQMSNRSLKES